MSDIKMLRPVEVMEKLRCSYPTLLRKVKAKEIPFIKLNNMLLFPSSYFIDLEKQAYSNYKQGRNEEVNCD